MAGIGIGLIGAGKHGIRYARHVREDIPELTLTALSRRDPERGRTMAREYGCRFHAEWLALVADPAVEAVIAVVPPTLHPPIAAAVAAAGKALLIEKPLAPTGAAAREIVRTIRAARIPCLMAHTLRWNAVVQTLRAELPALGTVHALWLNQRFEPSTLAWIDDPVLSGGGILLHTGVHSFDLVRYLTGREVVRAWCRTVNAVTRRTEDNFLAMLELEGAATLVAVGGCRTTGGRSGLIDIAGTGGQLVGDHALGLAYAIRGLERTSLPLPAPLPTVREVLRSFVRLLRAGEQPPAEIEDGARAVLIAEACLRSAASGAPTAVEPLSLPSA